MGVCGWRAECELHSTMQRYRNPYDRVTSRRSRQILYHSQSEHAPEIVELSRTRLFFSQHLSQMTEQQVFDLLQLLCNKWLVHFRNFNKKKMHIMIPLSRTANANSGLRTRHKTSYQLMMAEFHCGISTKNVKNIFFPPTREMVNNVTLKLREPGGSGTIYAQHIPKISKKSKGERF